MISGFLPFAAAVTILFNRKCLMITEVVIIVVLLINKGALNRFMIFAEPQIIKGRKRYNLIFNLIHRHCLCSYSSPSALIIN